MKERHCLDCGGSNFDWNSQYDGLECQTCRTRHDAVWYKWAWRPWWVMTTGFLLYLKFYHGTENITDGQVIATIAIGFLYVAISVVVLVTEGERFWFVGRPRILKWLNSWL